MITICKMCTNIYIYFNFFVAKRKKYKTQLIELGSITFPGKMLYVFYIILTGFYFVLVITQSNIQKRIFFKHTTLVISHFEIGPKIVFRTIY